MPLWLQITLPIIAVFSGAVLGIIIDKIIHHVSGKWSHKRSKK